MDRPHTERATAPHHDRLATATVTRPRRGRRNRMQRGRWPLLAGRSFAPALLCACVALGAFLSLTPGSH
jgi:hypothetical protein